MLLLVAVILTGVLGESSIAFAKGGHSSIDTSELKKGIVIVNAQKEAIKVDKVRVIKDKITYTYDYEDFMRVPLQSGNGSYQIQLLSHVIDNKFKQVAIETVDYRNGDGITIYLQSNIQVDWDVDMKAIKKAAALTKGLETDSEKVSAIYAYIINNYKYDNEKAKVVESGYIPSVEEVYRSKKGICYDYSVLFASMLRSLGIPAKVSMGTSKNVEGYHAWNEVYIDDKWITMDTTVDAGLGKMKTKIMEKKESEYSTQKQY